MAARFLGPRNLHAFSRRASATTIRSIPRYFVRWQSSEVPKRGISASRVLALGLTASGVVVSGGLVYANYDPSFRVKVNDYIPGFAGAADYVADRWLDVVDYFKSKTSSNVDKQSDKSELVFSENKPTEDPLAKIKIPDSTPKSKEAGPVKPPSGESSPGVAKETEKVAAQKKDEPQKSKKKETPSAQKKKEPDQPTTKKEPEQSAVKKSTSTNQEKKEPVQFATKKETSPVQDKKRPEKSPAKKETPPTQKKETQPSKAKKEGGTTDKKPSQQAPPKTSPAVATQPPKPEPSSTTAKEVAAPSSSSKGEELKKPATSPSPPVESTTKEIEGKDQGKPKPRPKEIDATVEGAVTSVKEATAKTAQEIMSEQIKEHQAAQSSDDHFKWLKDSAQVDVMLQEAYEVFKSVSEKVLEHQKALAHAISEYHKKLADVSQSSTDDVSSIHAAAGGVAESEEAVEAAKKNLDDTQKEHKGCTDVLKSLMDDATSLGLKSKVKELQETVASLVNDILSGANEIAKIESDSKVLKEYQQEVEKSEEKLKGELGTALPKADSQQEAVILMLQKRFEILKEKLGKMESEATQKVVAALEKQKQSLEQLAEEKLNLSLRKQEFEHRNELDKQLEEVIRDYKHKLREQLRAQTEAHTQHLAGALQTQAERLESKWVSELEFKLTEQETHFQTELAKAVARLKGIESMVETVANAGERTYQQQSLRSACDSLNTALERANSNPDPEDRYTFAEEISSLRKAARGDPFILSVLDSIPAEAANKIGHGIQSETALKERFTKVKRICKQVALVPESGGGLGTYALSYLQSLLTMSAWDIRASKVEESELSSLDTFGLLHQAEASLHRGDMENTIRCLNCLEGESRRVASDWMKDARLHLETRQAINLIQSYMAATSLAIVQN